MSEQRSISELLAGARERLAAAPFRPSTREAALLLGHVLSLSEAQVLARTEHRPEAGEVDRFEGLLSRRLAGEPVAYLFGEREFYGRPFRVDPRVLIPRPETEHLVEMALELDLPPSPVILDLGTGSGCLAITLALELPGARVVASDRSPGALAVAKDNSRRLGSERVRLVAGDLAQALGLSGFHLVVSNPPYVDPAHAASLSPEVTEYEPPQAIFTRREDRAGRGGTAVVERLLHELAPVPSGTPLLLEIGQGQEQTVRQLAANSPFEPREFRPDYAGIPRIARLRRR